MINNYLKQFGFNETQQLYHNLSPEDLTALALETEECNLSDQGALCVSSYPITGRSAKDKYVVDTPNIHAKIDWGTVNQPIDMQTFQAIKTDVIKHMEKENLYIFDGYAGADKAFQEKIRVVCTLASQSLFINNLLIRPTLDELQDRIDPEVTILVAPHFKVNAEKYGLHSSTAILLNLDEKEIIICGTQYSGEIKKSVFVLMNYLLPEQNVLPMHCSANIGKDNDTAIFFGLSGTGKTTLSTDPNRKMIGDDEHGWSENGVFNIEGGIYAKSLDLEEEKEPEIYHAIRPGAILENVTLDVNHKPIFTDRSQTENGRIAFPLNFIDNVAIPSVGTHPATIIFLTADAFGILPPVSKLTYDQAMYHFISGYTSKLAGTEQGITTPTATFSACFGAPFLPLPSAVYAEMLGEKIKKHQANVFLINTGWSGGGYSIGKRIALKDTRAIVTAALTGGLDDVEYIADNRFGLSIPTTCPGVDSFILNPMNTWENKESYLAEEQKLAQLFEENFQKFDNVSSAIKKAGPKTN